MICIDTPTVEVDNDPTLVARRGRSAYPIAVSAAVGLSVLLRLRFVTTPLTADEGGFVAIGRAWRHGADLYADAWVDRPQGLLVLFSGWDVVSGGSAQSVRVMAMLFGALAVIAGASAARSIGGDAAGVAAAVLVAVTSSVPALEGFIANGELLAGAVSASCVALALTAGSRSGGGWWMFASGVVGGLALSIKQSGIDGIAAVGLWLTLALIVGWRERRWCVRQLASLAAGLAVVIGPLVVHGLVTGWSEWWYAVYGYRASSRSVLTGADWGRFSDTARDAAPVLLPVAITCVVLGVLWLFRRRPTRSRSQFDAPRSLIALWCCTALATFAMGGQFFHHYWVVLTMPLSVVAGIVITHVCGRRSRAVVALVLLPALVSAASIVRLDRERIPVATTGYARSSQEEAVGRWFRTHATSTDSVYALCAGASVYAHANVFPPYPYLWLDNVASVPGGRSALRDLLLGSNPPSMIAIFQRPTSCGLSTTDDEAFTTRYRTVAHVDGIRIVSPTGGNSN